MAGLLNGARAGWNRRLLSSCAAAPWIDPAGYWNEVGASPPDRSGEPRLLEFLAGTLPVVGEAMSARDVGRYGAEAYLRARQGDYGGVTRQLPGLALSGLGMVPLLGGVTSAPAGIVDDMLRVPEHLRVGGATTKTFTVSHPSSSIGDIRIYQNPDKAMLDRLVQASKGGQMRYLFDGTDKIFWDAYLATHDEMANMLRQQWGSTDPQYSMDMIYP
jgi:hypothetical protein